jgi:hypothetical protein
MFFREGFSFILIVLKENRRNCMRNIKNITSNQLRITPEQREVLESGESILYTCENYLGNFKEKEVLKYDGKYYRVQASNKILTEYTEV